MITNNVAIIIVCVFVVEFLFYLYVRGILMPRVCQLLQGKEPRVADPHQQMEKIIASLKIISSKKVYSVDQFLMGWALGSKSLSDIKDGNILSFLAWAFFSVTFEEGSKNQKISKSLNKLYEQLEVAFPEQFAQIQPGLNPELKHARMCLDESVPVLHRPLLFYALLYLLKMVTSFVQLRCCGFQRHSISSAEMDVTYWVRKTTSDSESEKSPYVFFHGISHGWWSYAAVIKALASNRTIVLMNMDNISIGSLSFDCLSPKAYANSVRAILRKHGIRNKVTVFGHSFGSITAGWFLKYFPECVEHAILVDPVSVLLGLPNVAMNFLYRTPSTLMEWVIYIFASTEITIAHTLYRHFTWHHNIVWLDELSEEISVTVLACGADDILSGPAVHCYAGHHAEAGSQASNRGKSYVESIPEADGCEIVSNTRKVTTVNGIARYTRHASIYFPDYRHGEANSKRQAVAELAACVRQTESVVHNCKCKEHTGTAVREDTTTAATCEVAMELK
eukprot:GSChrysophyteH1.ASY1.ANO1.3314.1 assembled CDS